MSLRAYPVGSGSMKLYWTKPAEANGILTGYRIYYQVVNGSKLDPLREREPRVSDPNELQAKLPGLLPDTKYRIHIRATTKAGEGLK